MTSGAPRILALVPDLMDRSKLTGALGDAVELVATPVHLQDRLAAVGEGDDQGGEEAGPEIVVVDLGRRGVIDALPAVRAATPARIIAFGPHVERDLLAAARAAGCDEVLPRSAFFADVAGLLA